MDEIKDLRIVAGNDFYLKVPVRAIVFKNNEYGERVPHGERVDLDDCSMLGVNLIDECENILPLSFTVTEGDNSQLIVKVKGRRLLCGWYGLEVIYTLDGRNHRSYERKVFKIVEHNAQSYVQGSMYAGEMSYQVDTMWMLYAQESYPLFALDTDTMELVQYGTVENGRMYLDEHGKLCMEVEG